MRSDTARGLALSAMFLGAIAGSRPLVAQEQDGYAGSEFCSNCHQRQFDAFGATRKGPLFLDHPQNATERLGCEGCHGPGLTHGESGGELKGSLITFSDRDTTSIERRNQVCLDCHAGWARITWFAAAHESRGIACTSCHRIMATVSERSQLAKGTVTETCAQCHARRRAQMERFAHMPVREGKMDCTSCHNPHGTAGEKLLLGSDVNATCYACHQEKRGPFLWEHAPVAESCGNCHDPHGSSNEKLLVVPKPRLCQRCHDETRHPTRPYSADLGNSRFVYGRQCQNCHFNIHGSNHPSGARFTR